MTALHALECTVSVIMPTYRQAAFVARAISSLLAQTLRDWELIVIDDGSPDDQTGLAVRSFQSDARIRYRRLAHNGGLGAALNCGLDMASGRYIAYLPSDDVIYPDHLATLVALLDQQPQAIMAAAGVVHHYNRRTETRIPGHAIQLVQVLHRRCDERWLERSELVTDDLDRMFWQRLQQHGTQVWTGGVSCEWVEHPQQWHKRIREPEGGINAYRQYYGVRHPLRFHSTVGNLIDEVRQYQRFREQPPATPRFDRLRILLVGELAYNPERILALAEQGHQLHGLWMPEPYWYNTVGPLPFGHVDMIDAADWEQAVCALEPDVIYAQLNWQAVPFAHHVMRRLPGIPLVWHFKEGPFICLEKGTWPQLWELYSEADGRIFSSPEMQEWFALCGLEQHAPQWVLDGDLPKRDWLAGKRRQRLSARHGELHTVVAGRPIGLHPHSVAQLAAEGIHLHFYGDFTHGQWQQWITNAREQAPAHLHLHPHVDQSRWLDEFSVYDAGWLHSFASLNGGDLRRANWDDLNYPARMATYAVAGLPMIQRRNAGARVATQTLAEKLGIGLFYTDPSDLARQLRDEDTMEPLREQVWRMRDAFCFDHHAPALVEFLRRAIDFAHQRRGQVFSRPQDSRIQHFSTPVAGPSGGPAERT